MEGSLRRGRTVTNKRGQEAGGEGPRNTGCGRSSQLRREEGAQRAIEGERVGGDQRCLEDLMQFMMKQEACREQGCASSEGQAWARLHTSYRDSLGL